MFSEAEPREKLRSIRVTKETGLTKDHSVLYNTI